MKIVHVIESVDPSKGGPIGVATRLAAAQAALGHEVNLAYRETDGIDSGLVRFNSIPGFEMVQAAPCGRPGLGLIGRFVPSELSRLVALADIVHLHGIWDPMLWTAAGAAIRHRIHYVLTPHGMLNAWSLRQKRWKKWLALNVWCRRILRRAKFVHALNPSERVQIETLIDDCRMEVVPNGIFLEEGHVNHEGPSLSEIYPSLKGRRYLLFLGRLHYKKGLDYLASAFKLFVEKNADVDLVVAGPDEGALQPFQKMIYNDNLSDRTHIIGPVYGEEKAVILKNATCFCLPSQDEGFSLAIVEAMASGIPVVITSGCNFPEAAEVGAGIVVGFEPAEICNAFIAFSDDDERREQAGRAGRKLIVERYTWLKIAERLVACYSAPPSVAYDASA